ncbi:hypothetical protein [Actinoplanes auranticolor]|uniref:Mce-associated membrane protein n=1 Tax=Actinoplanes auranticolor TaxID=47988 RepID=A0A919W2N6_9ACTN|nr:hypothetical protein [Actinoplanes auranticolor]GIM77608.1 hypothetical protein Aau02nite_76740 [Actinoplanes auranticolor]
MNSSQLRMAILTGVLAAAAGCTSTTAVPDDRPNQAPAVTVASTSTSADTDADHNEDHDDGVGTAPSAPPATAALLAAQTYVRRWARPTQARDAWYADVQPLVVTAYGQLLADTDPTQVPARVVTGIAEPVSSTTAVLVADVPTDAGPIRVTVINTAGRWLIASASPAPTS